MLSKYIKPLTKCILSSSAVSLTAPHELACSTDILNGSDLHTSPVETRQAEPFILQPLAVNSGFDFSISLDKNDIISVRAVIF